MRFVVNGGAKFSRKGNVTIMKLTKSCEKCSIKSMNDFSNVQRREVGSLTIISK